MLSPRKIAKKLIIKFLIVCFLFLEIILIYPDQVRAEGSQPNVNKKTDCFLVLGGSCGSKDSTSNAVAAETEIKPGANLSGKLKLKSNQVLTSAGKIYKVLTCIILI